MKGRANIIDARIGERIKLRRLQIGASQEQMAEDLALTFQQVQKFESGANRVSIAHLWRIAKFLNVSIGYFFDNIDKPSPFENLKPAVRQILVSRDGFNLHRNFSEISSPTMRTQVIALTKSIAETERG